MTHGITFDRPPEPIVEVMLDRELADTIAEALTIALDCAAIARDADPVYDDQRAVLALIRASDRLERPSLALTPALFVAAWGAVVTVQRACEPDFAAGLVETPSDLALLARCRALDPWLLAVAADALMSGRALCAGAERFAAAPRLN